MLAKKLKKFKKLRKRMLVDANANQKVQKVQIVQKVQKILKVEKAQKVEKLQKFKKIQQFKKQILMPAKKLKNSKS